MTYRRHYPKSQRFCVRCIVNSTRACSKLCVACRDTGWRWCSAGQHVTNLKMNNKHRCQSCHADYHYRRWLRLRPQPPAGYVRLSDAARKLGFSRSALTYQIRAGIFPYPTWRDKAISRSPWYVEVQGR
jgi:hypothetical protein